MREANLLLLLWCYCSVVAAKLGDDNSSKQLMPHRRLRHGKYRIKRRLSNMMMPGERVSAMDKGSAICSANTMSEKDVPIERTVISYYYAIESTEQISTANAAGRSLIRSLEDELYRSIRPAILWCYYDETDDTRRDLMTGDKVTRSGSRSDRRRLTFDEARHLSVVSFSTSPEDEETSIKCNYPSKGDSNCIVMHGMVTLMHHTTSDVSLAIASIYDATQKAMDFSELYLSLDEDENTAGITNIVWLGETEEDAIGVIVNIDEINSEIQKEDRSLLAYALAIPILILIALALFVSKKRSKPKAMTKDQLVAVRSFDDVLIGTGDHPESFHEGMYHYTREGVRYLSTNCPTCIETKKHGFFTAAELDTISERSNEIEDPSAHRRNFLVSALDSALGKKHSAIDVHNCNSARCPICIYQPQDVLFISKSEDFESIRQGESEI